MYLLVLINWIYLSLIWKNTWKKPEILSKQIDSKNMSATKIRFLSPLSFELLIATTKILSRIQVLRMRVLKLIFWPLGGLNKIILLGIVFFGSDDSRIAKKFITSFSLVCRVPRAHPTYRLYRKLYLGVL
jgi:hypothetical protein